MAKFYRVRPLDEKIRRGIGSSGDNLYVAFSIPSALWWADTLMEDENINSMVWAMDEIEIPDDTMVAVFGDSWKGEFLGKMTAGEAKEINLTSEEDAQVMVLEKGKQHPFQNIGIGIGDRFINQTQRSFYQKYYNFMSSIINRFNSIAPHWSYFYFKDKSDPVAELINTYNEMVNRARLSLPVLYDLLDFLLLDMAEDELTAIFGDDFNSFFDAIGTTERLAKLQPKYDILNITDTRLSDQVEMIRIMYENMVENAISFPNHALRILQDFFTG